MATWAQKAKKYIRQLDDEELLDMIQWIGKYSLSRAVLDQEVEKREEKEDE